ncbi:MAG: serine/threonine-protein kinase, partial [Acidobacteriota bacterium]
MIGQTISHYKIIEKISEGGMGEVYRATDTKLNRDVALKVLPDVFAQDQRRMARFEREAQLLASLNHPNIAAIHGLEEADGVCFLVLELVEGETLAERVAKGPLPTEEVLEVCRQIADGVEAAHAKGVIHRDLKPSNVKITPEGLVKVLDFGLAKAFRDESTQPESAETKRRAAVKTQAGVILGTPAYMSPEQVRADRVDNRSDIWAFGCLLF